MKDFSMRFLLVLITVFVTISGCTVSPEFQVVFDSRHHLQEGDKLYMNEVAIGEIEKISLVAPDKVTCLIKLGGEYADFINSSSVFTYESDPLNTDRQCLVCKNCDDMSPAMKQNQEFQGMGFIAYSLACLGQKADDVWMRYMRDTLEEMVGSGNNFKEESRKKIETFARTNGEAFEKALHDLNGLIKELGDNAQDTLAEIRKSARTKQ